MTLGWWFWFCWYTVIYALVWISIINISLRAFQTYFMISVVHQPRSTTLASLWSQIPILRKITTNAVLTIIKLALFTARSLKFNNSQCCICYSCGIGSGVKNLSNAPELSITINISYLTLNASLNSDIII